MNKIFKVVWSKTKECYVVVSEVAKNNGGKKKVLASVLAGLAIMGAAAQMGTPVQAGTDNRGSAVNLWADKQLDGTTPNTANTVGANSVAIGNNLVAGSASTTPTGRLGGTAIAIGVDSQAKDDRDIAIGYNNTTEGQDSFAMGSNVIAGTGQSIAIGSTNTDAKTGAQTQTIARGKVTMKNGRPEPAAAIAIGVGAQALDGSGVLAMGQLAKAVGNNDVAIGTQTKVEGNNSTAIGSTAQALGNSSAAYGTQAIANGLGATAVGPGANAGTGSDAAEGATAVGRGAKAIKEGASALGWAANASVTNAAAIGRDTTANIEGGVALGYQSKTTTAAGVQGYNPASDRTNKYSTQGGAVGTSTLAAVSVGNGTTATRQITGLAAGTEDTDAVNVAQLKNVNLKYAGDTGNSDVLLKDGTLNIKGDDKFISTSADANGVKITAKVGENITTNTDGKAVAPTTNGIATTTNVTNAINNSGWKANASANGGTLTGSATATKVVPGDTVTFSAGKNLTVEQTLGTNTQQYTYGLSSTLKDIQSIQNGTSKITLNNAGGTTISGGNLSVDGNKITKVAQGTDGTDAVNVDQLNAVAAKERHVKPGNYAVDGNGTVTLNYVDGNNADVADTAVISGIAKDDLSNITDAGKNVITGLGTIVKAGDNVTVSEASDATTGQKTYTVNAVTPAVYTKADGTKVVKRPDGTFTTNLDGSAGNDVPASDVIVSFQDAAGNTTGGNSIVNNVGSAIDKTGTSTGDTFLTKLDTAANDTPNAAVNVKDLKNTSDAIIGKGLKFDANDGGEKTNKLGSKVTVKGEGTKANTEYSGTNIKTIIAQTGDDTTIDVKLAKDLTGINSISNTAAGPKMEFGGNSINITGGNLDLGGSKITNLGPATSGSDAVNYDQLKNSRTEVKSSDGSVTVTPTTSGDKTTYDLKVATTGTVAKSTWNIASDKVSATEGTVAAGSGAAQNIADTKTVTMQAGKNLTVNQTNDNGNASVAFALDKDLKDLTSVTTDKVTTKEIGLQDAAGNTTTIKKDGDRITYTNDGGATNKTVATLDDEKHIKPGSYAVQNDGSVTMTYVDGNGNPVANDEAKITGIAKQDLSNITDAGKNVITGLGTIVKAGDNVTVSEASDATTGQKTYTVNAVTPAVYTKADGTKVVKRPDGTFTTNLDGSAGNDVPASDVIVSFQDAAGNTTGGNSIVNNVGSAIDKTGTSTGDTFLTKLDTAANDTPNAAVNVKDLKNTSDAIIGKGLKFDANDGGEKTNKLGSKVTVKGEGTKANTEYSGTNIKTIIAQTGDDTTIDVKLAKDLTGINSIANTVGGPTMTFGGNSIKVTGGNLDLGGNKITDLAPGTDDTDAVNYKQLKAAKTVVAAGTNVTVAKTTGANGEDVYTVSASGGTGGAASTWNLKSGVASATEGTHSGDTTQNIADTKSVTLQAGKNLTVKQTNDGNGNTDVAYSLDSDLKDLTSVTTEKVTTKEIGLQDPTGKVTTIKNDGDRITYTKDGDTKVHKVATLDDEMHIKDTTYTVDGNKKVTMTYVDGNGNPVAGKTAVIDLSGLPVGETDTDMRIKEGTYTAQNGKVTLNTVDKGGNPVTGKDVVIDGINTNNYVAGDNVTLTPDTDAAGKPVVKINAALSTEKVVKKAGADNLATVSTASGNVAGDKGETYEVAVTKGDIENNAEISYKANGGTAQKTTLANGFNFTSDDNSVAITTGANGKVNFKVDTTGIQGKAFNLDVDKEGTGKVENAQTAATTKSVEKGTKFVAGNNLSIRRDAINGDANYDHQVTYALNSDLQGITSITNNGGATMNFGPNEVSITGGNLNMGDHKITNVKNGTDKSDVATVGQLTKVTSNDNTVAINKTTDADGAPVYDLSVQGGGHDPRVDQLGEEIGRVGAQGAALAALKPIQYDPLEPTQIMAGYGNYRGNSAIAMGVAHYKNESTMMHAGLAWAGGSRHMMANAGVTWKVGNRDSEAAVADRYRKGPISSAYAMQQEMASVKAQNAGLKTEVSDLKAENEQMKAQIAAMMAKLGM